MRLDQTNTMVSKSLLYHFKHESYHRKTVSLKMPFFTFRDLTSDQRRSHGGILGILGSPGSLTGPKNMGPERSMKLLAEERRVSGNGN